MSPHVVEMVLALIQRLVYYFRGFGLILRSYVGFRCFLMRHILLEHFIGASWTYVERDVGCLVSTI